jgi:hypothetical protein
VLCGIATSGPKPLHAKNDLLLSIAMQSPNSIDQVSKRIDKALAANRRTEILVVVMAVFIFLLGMAMIILGYWHQSLYLRTVPILLQGLLYWPIREIMRLRQDNLILQTLPAIVSTLPARECAMEMKKTLDYLRRRKR